MNLKAIGLISVVFLASCSRDPVEAQSTSGCSQCIDKADACILRTTGPLSKLDIGEASTLLEDLEKSKKALAAFRDTSDSNEANLSYYVPSKDGECYNGSYMSRCWKDLRLGKIGDVREMVNGILKAQIERTTCRLRAIGVDIPRP